MDSFKFIAAVAFLLLCNPGTSSRLLLSRHGGDRYHNRGQDDYRGHSGYNHNAYKQSDSYKVRDRASGRNRNGHGGRDGGNDYKVVSWSNSDRGYNGYNSYTPNNNNNHHHNKNKNNNGYSYGSNKNYKSGGDGGYNNDNGYDRKSDSYDGQVGSAYSGYSGADRNNHNNEYADADHDHDHDNTNHDNQGGDVNNDPWGDLRRQYSDASIDDDFEEQRDAKGGDVNSDPWGDLRRQYSDASIDDDFEEQRDRDTGHYDDLFKDSYESYGGEHEHEPYHEDFDGDRHDVEDVDHFNDVGGWNPPDIDFEYGNPHGSPEHGYDGGWPVVIDYSRDGYRGYQTPLDSDNEERTEYRPEISEVEPLKEGNGSPQIEEDDYAQEKDRDDGHFDGLFRDSYESDDERELLPRGHEDLRDQSDDDDGWNAPSINFQPGNPYGSPDRGYDGGVDVHVQNDYDVENEFRSGSNSGNGIGDTEQPKDGIPQGRVQNE
eukprot:CAMPEP_0202727572 /NCGR_PEP_ID=MMETSP1385-20130828/185188_1 /ASSEMBLY_ACC=CAM_ASM_000861 /TAXON_ID=933848 /ORGANISM="Elphidium margaritaceum" /LENGTH=486 /DNA_ID=CAMNT_0049393815 /DNA_START=66 /DNA_END=1527 /DNA_ORIENTATION=-